MQYSKLARDITEASLQKAKEETALLAQAAYMTIAETGL